VDGNGGHTGHEQLYLSSIAPRARLMYRLMETL
jgi:glutamate carboxypeptidase